MTFMLAKFSLTIAVVLQFFLWHTMFVTGCVMFRMKDVWDLGLSLFGIFGIWGIQDMGCWGCGMFETWDVRDVGCLRCEMFGI